LNLNRPAPGRQGIAGRSAEDLAGNGEDGHCALLPGSAGEIECRAGREPELAIDL